MADLLSYSEEELTGLITGWGYERYRGAQTFGWLHRRFAQSPGEMTNLPAALREELAHMPFGGVTIAGQRLSADGTRKYLMALAEGDAVESVFMRYEYGSSVCVSSQAGCRMGCAFCATAQNGLSRSLSAGEMVSQIYAISRYTGERVSHCVVMGCGEPLDNYAETLRFIWLLTGKSGVNMGARHITVSTCGLIERIEELAALKLPINLAVSLHAPNDEIRKGIMPIAAAYPIDRLIRACAAYAETTGRRVTYEYALIDGVNDSPAHAAELSRRLRHTLCHVNLIPLNPVENNKFRKSSKEKIDKFCEMLYDNGISVTKRRVLGDDVSAACGQLRSSAI